MTRSYSTSSPALQKVPGTVTHREMMATDICRGTVRSLALVLISLAPHSQSRSETSRGTSKSRLDLVSDVFKALLPLDFINKTRLNR